MWICGADEVTMHHRRAALRRRAGVTRDYAVILLVL